MKNGTELIAHHEESAPARVLSVNEFVAKNEITGCVLSLLSTFSAT